MIQILFKIITLSLQWSILSSAKFNQIRFKLGHRTLNHKLIFDDYDTIIPDFTPMDLTVNLFISHFKSITYLNHNRPEAEVFEARARLKLEWVDSRINSIHDIFKVVYYYNLNMRLKNRTISKPVRPYSKDISFYYDPRDSPTLWMPFIFSENIINLTAKTDISSAGMIRVSLDFKESILYVINVDIEFECMTNPVYYPFDILKCDLYFDSSEAINLRWNRVEIHSIRDDNDRYLILKESIVKLSKETLIPCTNRKMYLPFQNSCLRLNFFMKRNVSYFDWILFFPIIILMIISYSTLYFSLLSYRVRTIINGLVMISLINLYLLHPMLIYNTALMATSTLSAPEALLFSAIFYNILILSSTIVQIGCKSFKAWLKSKKKINKENDETESKEQNDQEAKSSFKAFVEWLVIKIFFFFVYGQENTVIDLVSRFIGVIGLIAIPVLFKFYVIHFKPNWSESFLQKNLVSLTQTDPFKPKWKEFFF